MRKLLLASAVLLSLAACAGQNGSPPAPASVAQDVSLLAQSLGAVVSELQGVTVPAALPTALADLQSVANAVAGADTVNAALPLVQRVESDVNAVAAIPVAQLPAKAQTWLADARVLLPVIEAAVNMAVPAQADLNGLTPDQARTQLRLMAAAE